MFQEQQVIVLASSIVAQTENDQLGLHIGARFQPHISAAKCLNSSTNASKMLFRLWMIGQDTEAAVRIFNVNALSCIQGPIKGWL